MSLDGFVAGQEQSPENPLGVGGHLLHDWMRALAAWRRDAGLQGGEVNASTVVYEQDDNAGAIIMGRNMFGGGAGPRGTSPPALSMRWRFTWRRCSWARASGSSMTRSVRDHP